MDDLHYVMCPSSSNKTVSTSLVADIWHVKLRVVVVVVVVVVLRLCVAEPVSVSLRVSPRGGIV